MTNHAYRTARSLVLAASAFALGGMASTLSAAPDAGPTEVKQVSAGASEMLTRASDLMVEGKLIRARAMLIELSRGGSAVGLTDRESMRLFQLLSSVDARLRAADPVDVSLQKAELAMTRQDLVTAERHAREVIDAPGATSEQRESSQAVLMLVNGQRQSMRGAMARLADQAALDFEGGKYAEAKAALERVTRVGADIGAQRAAKADRYLGRIVELERINGELFDTSSVRLSVMEGPAEDVDWLLSEQPDDVVGLLDAQPATTQPAQDAPAATTQPEPVTAPAVDLVEVDVQPSDPIDRAENYQANVLLGEADAAFAERRLVEAGDKYRQALSVYGSQLTGDQRQHIQNRLDEISIELGAQPTAGGPLDDFGERNDLIRQRTEAQFRNQMEQARTALESGDVSAARNLTAQARLTVNEAAGALDESTRESYLSEVDELNSIVAQREEQIRIQETEDRAAQIERQRQQLEAERQAANDKQILDAIERIRQLQLELKYEEALQVVDQILFIDPQNPAGLLLRDVIQDTIIYRQYMDIQREKSLSYAKQAVENEAAMVLPERIIAYPDDWPAISFLRGEPSQFAESAANRAALASIQDKTMPVNFQDNALVDVLGFIESYAGVNMDVDWLSLDDIGIDQETPVNLSLSAVPVETVLDRVLEKVSDPDLPASWAITDGILTIASDEVLRRNTSLEIYDIRDLLIEVPDYDEAPEFDLQSILQAGQGGGGQSPFSGQTQDRERVPREERVEQITTIVQNTIDPDGWTDLGGDTSSIQELNGNLIITTTPRIHREIIGLLGKLRQVRAMQINVETRFLLVDQNFFEQIGFDLDVYFNSNNEFAINRALDPSLRLSDYVDPNTGRPTGNLGDGTVGGANGLPIDTDGDTVPDALGQIVQPIFAPGTQGDEWSVIPATQNSFGITNSLATASSFAAGILSQNPALSVAGTFLDDIQVDFLVQATQADQRSVSLTAPRLTFTNGQTANIVVATQTAFISNLTPVVSDSAVGFDPNITPLNECVRLLIDGVVSADRRYVTLNVDAQIAELVGFEERTVTAVAGGQLVDSADTGSVIQLPSVTVTAVQTTSTIPDQGTILLGGQRIINELEVESGVPVLSKIPILSRFFSNRVDVKEEQTLLILLKPTILIQNEEEERNFPGLLDSLPY
ncbi:MAG: hypothetical protein ACIARR_04980 [Phycisphaerales bacterium JB059]